MICLRNKPVKIGFPLQLLFSVQYIGGWVLGRARPLVPSCHSVFLFSCLKTNFKVHTLTNLKIEKNHTKWYTIFILIWVNKDVQKRNNKLIQQKNRSLTNTVRIEGLSCTYNHPFQVFFVPGLSLLVDARDLRRLMKTRVFVDQDFTNSKYCSPYLKNQLND